MNTNKENITSQEAPMKITSAAVEKLKAMRAKEGKEGYAVRVGVVTGGCAGLSYDLRFQKTPYENDIIFQAEDLTVIINPDALSSLKGIELDYIDTLKESGFKYRNPNAKSSCGCGTSFS